MFSTRLYLHILLYVAAILLVSALGVAGICSGRAVIFGSLSIVGALALAAALARHLNAYNRRIKFLLDAIGEEGTTFRLAPQATTSEQRALQAAINRISAIVAEQKRKEFERQLNQKEYESWEKLMRVLTHEIMNTISPIVSLSDTLLSYYSHGSSQCASPQTLSPTEKRTARGLQTIREQSQSLLHFTESCRQLSGLRQPRQAMCPLNKLLQSVLTLYQDELGRLKIGVSLRLPHPPLTIYADGEQLSQVFINLLKNAIQALQQREYDRAITIETGKKAQTISIRIADNGPGFPSKLREEIFIPFFTTKSDGTGIGLSLSRQIVRMHGGDLTASSQPDEGASFTISLPISNSRGKADGKSRPVRDSD